jgi:hypothetical protein
MSNVKSKGIEIIYEQNLQVKKIESKRMKKRKGINAIGIICQGRMLGLAEGDGF